MDRSTATARSKFLSLILRHRPERVGLELDPAGWVEVDRLLEACRSHGSPLTREELEAVVAGSDKQRFSLSDDGLRIRASQGHTVDVELGYQPATPPELLFHGTVERTLPAIRSGGLKRMQRHAVHLSSDEQTASAVGGRRGRPVIVRVRAGEMHRAGHRFERSANGVWLTEEVPKQYLDLPDGHAPGGKSERAARTRIANETLAACEAGGYCAPDGARVELRALVDQAVRDTRLHDRAAVESIELPSGKAGRVEVTDESTNAALRRLDGAPRLACLNFASARNPGGGFLGGAQAQEESLARSSGLYPCLLSCLETYYLPNRAHVSLLYLDLAIVSPEVPFFRDDAGGWLERPILASVITCAAPNAQALQEQGSAELARVPEVLLARAELVLRCAVHHRFETLVLGAWGAGVFGNDPALVARTFGALLDGPFRGAFDRVVFAVLDGKPGRPVLAAFQERFR